MRTLLVTLLSLLLAVPAWSQRPWEAALADLVGTASDDDADWEGLYDELCDLEQHPIHLSRATRDDLERLPFLSGQQVQDLMEYLDRHGPMLSLGELQLVTSLTPATLSLLPYFIVVGAPEPRDTLASLRNIVRYGRHQLLASAQVPFYERAGDRNGYLGYRYRHWLRYDFSYAQQLRLGVVAAQDAGEPFFAAGNGAGYDYYSPYLEVRRWGRLEQLVAGRYKMTSALGLVLGSSFSLGKTATLSTLGRSASLLRPHVSRSESDYFQGVAATLRLSSSWRLTAFASYRPLDATLNDDGTARTLLTSGYHRTPVEMSKKHNLDLFSTGGKLSLHANRWNAGLTAVYSRLTRELCPDVTTRYRRYYPAGTNFLNASADYGYTSRRFSFQGETALNGDGAVATLNTASIRLADEWTLVALQRFYSFRYTSLHAHSFSEGGHVQNESGFFLGATWQPFRRLRLQAFADYAYFPWARYRVSASSHAWDAFLQADYQTGAWTLDARYRLRLRQQDNAAKTALTGQTTHRARLSATVQQTVWSLRSQADLSHVAGSSGVMVSEHLALTFPRWRWQLTAAWFRTDDYSTRLYLYERGMLNTFSNYSFYGHGLRLALTGRWDVGRSLLLVAKLGTTYYSDRETVGSGLQLIDGSTKTDLDVQLRWKF